MATQLSLLQVAPPTEAPAPQAIEREVPRVLGCVAPTAAALQTMDRKPPAPICATDAEAEAWAEQWWRSYEGHVKAHEGVTYHEPEGLYALLEGDELPPVKLLRLSWLLERAAKLEQAKTVDERRALALPRRQLLEQYEPGAFLSPAEVRRLPRGHIGHTAESCGLSCDDDGYDGGGPRLLTAEDRADRPLKVISISHGELRTSQRPQPSPIPLPTPPPELCSTAPPTLAPVAGWLTPEHPSHACDGRRLVDARASRSTRRAAPTLRQAGRARAGADLQGRRHML